MSDLDRNAVLPAEDSQVTKVDQDTTAVADGYTVKLDGPGLTLERAVPGTVALQIVALAMSPGGAQPVQLPVTPTGGTVHQVATPVPANNHAVAQPARQAVGEYVRATGAKRNADKIVAIAAWLYDQRGQHTFARDEVKTQFRGIGEPPPQNWSRDFQSTVSFGWIAPDDDDPNVFWVTQTGRAAIAAQFSGDSKPRITRRPRSRRKSAESASEKDEA
jgi:hypothetical protein